MKQKKKQSTDHDVLNLQGMDKQMRNDKELKFDKFDVNRRKNPSSISFGELGKGSGSRIILNQCDGSEYPFTYENMLRSEGKLRQRKIQLSSF